MLCSTYEILILNLNPKPCDREIERVKEVLKNLNERDYYMRLHYSESNNLTRYIPGIIVLRKSLEDAESVAQEIIRRLNEAGLELEKIQTELLYNGVSYYQELKN